MVFGQGGNDSITTGNGNDVTVLGQEGVVWALTGIATAAAPPDDKNVAIRLGRSQPMI